MMVGLTLTEILDFYVQEPYGFEMKMVNHGESVEIRSEGIGAMRYHFNNEGHCVKEVPLYE